MPKTHSASLRVAHHTTCMHASKTAMSSLDDKCNEKGKIVKACETCPKGWPRYYVSYRNAAGKVRKEDRTANRRDAERALQKKLDEIDSGTLAAARPRKTFTVWAAKYIDEVLPVGGRKGSTIRAYGPTVRYGEAVFGPFNLEQIGNAELRSFVNAIRKNKGTDATVSKHLRHLGAIMEAAVDEGLTDSNPVRKFKKSLRLNVPSGDESYTDVELAKLWAKMDALGYEPVYKFVARASVVTGARLGELIALEWDALDLTAGTLTIAHTWDPVDGLQAPKDRDARTVHLLPPARQLFESWVALVGVYHGRQPIFTAPRGGDRLNGQYVSRLVDKARKAAGIPDVGEHGRKRKPFHAFRACYARVCRERGLDPQFVQAELGHSDPRLTLETYGKWSTAARLAEAAKADTFPV